MIETMDIYPQHLIAAPLFSDLHHVAPLASEPAWYPFVVEKVKKNAIDMAVPTLDREIANLANLRSQHALGECICLCPSIEAIRICNDKWLCNETLIAAGIPVPPFARADSDAAREGWLLKPREGFGSHGIVKLNRSNIAYALNGVDPERYLLQQAFGGREVTVDAFIPRKGGQAQAIGRERIETKEGICSKARLFYNQSVLDMAERVGTALGLKGAFCFQIIESETGADNWAVIDVNPRTGGATSMSATIGFDIIGANLLDAFDLEYADRLQLPVREHFVVRQPTDYLTS